MFGYWRGNGSCRNGSGSRGVGDIGDGFVEPSIRPNWDALENRRGDDWEDGRGLISRALPLTYREFKDAGPLAGYFISNTNKIIETTFAGNPEALQYASKRLVGRLLDDDPSWDLSVAFDMLPRIPIRLRFIGEPVYKE